VSPSARGATTLPTNARRSRPLRSASRPWHVSAARWAPACDCSSLSSLSVHRGFSRQAVAPRQRVTSGRRAHERRASARQRAATESMTKPAIIITPAAPQGFCWQIIADGTTLKSGTTATEFEACTMADAVLKEIEKEVGQPRHGGATLARSSHSRRSITKASCTARRHRYRQKVAS